MIRISRRVGLLTVLLCLVWSAAAPAAVNTRVSVSSAGIQGNGYSGHVGISPDGRYVVFESAATNLVEGDINGKSDIFWHDRQTGETLLVSGLNEQPFSWWDCVSPSVSAEGRYVAFETKGKLFDEDHKGQEDVFRWDRETGETKCVSLTSQGTWNEAESQHPSMTPDGRFVVFDTQGDLGAGFYSYRINAWVYDCRDSLLDVVSLSDAGAAGDGDSSVYPGHAMSEDGRYVVFTSSSTNLVAGDTNGNVDVFLRDRKTNRTERVSVDSEGHEATGGYSGYASISADGRYVAFTSTAANLVSNDTNGASDCFVRDRLTGTTTRVSVSSLNKPGDAASSEAMITADGHRVVFTSDATNLVADDANGVPDVFVRDLQSHLTYRVSVKEDGSEANDRSEYPAPSADGRYVAFQSFATDFVDEDTNKNADIFVHALPTAAFSADPVVGIAPLAVAFADESFGSPTTWSWDFGDGQTATTQSPSHTYATPGVYTVSLTVTYPSGSDTELKTDYIDAAQVVAEFAAAPTAGAPPLAVTFTDQSLGAPTAWSWSFGDGGKSTAQNPTHTYTVTGKYTVSLTASSAHDSDTELKVDYINAAVAPPVADFQADPVLGYIPLAVTFTDTSTNGPTTWSWTFGDGATSTIQSPSHTYATAGSFTVSLTVSNASGSDTESKSGRITALPPAPVAGFTATPLLGAAPLLVTFTDTSTGAPTSWQWAFGDGTVATDHNPTHTYTTPGHYTVALVATNAGGSNTKTQERLLAVGFADTAATFWAFSPILACYEAGVVTGYSDGTYRPASTVTRDQMAVYISRALAKGDKNVPTGPATASFTDVGTEHWAFKYVEYAKQEKVVTGYADNTYRPTAPVTRDQMAAYIARAIATPTGDDGLASYVAPPTPSFTDVATSFWAYKYIEYCKEQKVVTGYSDTTYRPATEVTRDQMAVYVQRAFGLE